MTLTTAAILAWIVCLLILADGYSWKYQRIPVCILITLSCVVTVFGIFNFQPLDFATITFSQLLFITGAVALAVHNLFRNRLRVIQAKILGEEIKPHAMYSKLQPALIANEKLLTLYKISQLVVVLLICAFIFAVVIELAV